MEEKIGYALITTEEYRELIEENKRLDLYNDDLLDEIADLKNKYKELKGRIAKIIKNEEHYHFKNVEVKNGDVLDDYHYSNIKNAFTRYGIFEEKYIKAVILDFKAEQVLEETNEESEGEDNE